MRHQITREKRPTQLLRVAGAQLATKGGAEGVCCAALPSLGYGIALKIEDGGARGTYVALGAILAQLGLLDAQQSLALAEILHPPVRNVAGRIVGELRPVPPSPRRLRGSLATGAAGCRSGPR